MQPVIERDVHEKHVQHTTIPVHQVTHEAPILHESQVHSPMAMKEYVAPPHLPFSDREECKIDEDPFVLLSFVKGGGDLSSNLTHDKAGVLATGECDREVRGPGEKLAEKLHLGGGNSAAGTATSSGVTGAGATGMTEARGTTGGTGVDMGENNSTSRS